ncbi:MAG: hypothetical protein MK052_07785 [Alphaproteobacteria bacterium]|nr:hypothetical protein [Alphaproteobacteria bacterium]
MVKNLILLCFSLLIFGNIFAFVALYIFTGHSLYGQGYETFKATFKKPHEELCHIPHPFFGQLNCYDIALNGEISSGEPLFTAHPQPQSEHPIRVLVLGGSLAKHLSTNVSSNNIIPQPIEFHGQHLEHTQILQTVLNRHFSTDRIVVDNAALGGGKQPQQLFKLQYLLMLGQRYDIVINLDGFNEIVLPMAENRALGNYAAYPRSYSRLVNSVGNAASAQCLPRANYYADHTSWHPLSEVGHLIYIKWCHRNVEFEALSSDNPLATASQYKSPASDTALVAEEVAIWKQASLAIAKLAQVYDFSYVHIIQPNQYDKNSKPLSEEESAQFLANTHYGEPVAAYYSQLNFKGWPTLPNTLFIDARKVYSQHKETLYRDDCCHVNNRGIAILSEAIAQRSAPLFEKALKLQK